MQQIAKLKDEQEFNEHLEFNDKNEEMEKYKD